MADDTGVLLTPEEAARRLRIGRTRFFALLRSGDIASVKIGASRRVTPRALDDYVRKLTTTPPAVAVPEAADPPVAPRRQNGRRRHPSGQTDGLHTLGALRLPFIDDDSEGGTWPRHRSI